MRPSSPPLLSSARSVQGWPKRRSPGLVNFVNALAYHFCLALPAAFTQPGAHLLAEHCTILSVTMKCTCVLNMRFCTSEAFRTSNLFKVPLTLQLFYLSFESDDSRVDKVSPDYRDPLHQMVHSRLRKVCSCSSLTDKPGPAWLLPNYVLKTL